MPREQSHDSRINLEQARKQAKDLVKGFKAGDLKTLDNIRWNHPRFHGKADDDIKAGEFVLADAQLVVARNHHIPSWAKLLQHVEAIERADPAITRFERAADAIVSGSLELLQAMLREHPSLIDERSTRGHRSTLLHYVSANGVENYRQITPSNILDITRLLLESGAEVDAPSEAYGGGSTTMWLTATSQHPRLAGLQIQLLDMLLDAGAVIGPVDASHKVVHYCLANGCPEAAAHLVKRGAKNDSLYGASGLGDLEAVRALFDAATVNEREKSLLVAVACDQTIVADYLLERGVSTTPADGMTPLHWAAANGNLAMMDVLIARGAPLEALNEYGGTVLSSTLWFAYNTLPQDFSRRNFPAVINRLIAAGARTDRYPEMLRDIEGVYQRANRDIVEP
jgi:ankyrin repeat protein